MAEYQVTRSSRVHVKLPYEHWHVVAVEINGQTRSADEVMVEIRNGADIYTLSPADDGKRSGVLPWTCCGANVLRSDMDAVRDNNLMNLPAF